MDAKKIFYSGHVQGVGFRYSVKQIAVGFDVSGMVRNLPDGRVELHLQGDAGEVEAMVEQVDQSHLSGLIKEKEVIGLAPDPVMRGFRII